MKFEDVVATLITYEGNTKKIIKMIAKTYGKKFIEDTLSDNQVQKKERYKTQHIMSYYNLQLKNNPTKQKKQLRVMTALHFNISEKAVQYHITKSKS